MNPKATVILTTRNRREELRVALRSAVRQSVPVEVLVFDDGSTDGTADMAAAEFPSVRVLRAETSAGLIVRRNQLAQEASCPIVVSIDDDAEFSSPTVVERTLADFDDARIGAVAIPFVNVKLGPDVLQAAPERRGRWVTDAFIGTAHAIRRDLFLRLGGYRSHLVHQGEEMDYCVRLLDSGYVVRLGGANPILHYESPRRSFDRMDYYGRRNDLLYTWQNVPFPECLAHGVVNQLNALRHLGRTRRFRFPLSGTLCGAGWCVANPGARRPVRRSTYWLSRKLKKGPLPLEQIAPLLPPLPRESVGYAPGT